jgi:hypothetical protein
MAKNRASREGHPLALFFADLGDIWTHAATLAKAWLCRLLRWKWELNSQRQFWPASSLRKDEIVAKAWLCRLLRLKWELNPQRQFWPECSLRKDLGARKSRGRALEPGPGSGRSNPPEKVFFLSSSERVKQNPKRLCKALPPTSLRRRAAGVKAARDRPARRRNAVFLAPDDSYFG